MWKLIQSLLAGVPPKSRVPPVTQTIPATPTVPQTTTANLPPSTSGTLSTRSEKNLKGIHPDLVKVVRRAHELMGTDLDFIVIEGLRTQQRQAELVASGASRTMNSRHLTGHAIDLAASVKGSIRWDWPLYHRIASAMKAAAQELGVAITWGGDWKTFKDGPHFELDWKKYP